MRKPEWTRGDERVTAVLDYHSAGGAHCLKEPPQVLREAKVSDEDYSRDRVIHFAQQVVPNDSKISIDCEEAHVETRVKHGIDHGRAVERWYQYRGASPIAAVLSVQLP